MDEQKLREIFATSISKSEVCRKLDLLVNGGNLDKITGLACKYNIDITHFNPRNRAKILHNLVDKICPVCSKEFRTNKGKKAKTVCSHSCANTYFRSGKNHPNYKENSTSYRKKCIDRHGHKCAVCGFEDVIHVHHIDENRDNNNIDNLIPLCPNHHYLIHKKNNKELKNIVIKKANQ